MGRGYGGDNNGGAGEVIAQAIRTIGVILVVLIIAYVVLRLTGTIEGIIFSSPEGSSPSGGSTGIVGGGG